MATVKLRPGESQEQLLKRFRKEVQKARILSTARKKRFFISNSEDRRIAQQRAKRRERQRHRKAQRRNRW